MEILISHFEHRLRSVSTTLVRECIDEIAWDERLSAIVGPRGVGKTTLILQYIKKHYGDDLSSVLYTSMEELYFSNHTLLETAEVFVARGGRHLFLDEIHRYSSWSREVKLIYDTFPDLKVTISGSSLLQIINSEADLSRRCITYTMQGLSFREFIQFYKGLSIKTIALKDIVEHGGDVCRIVTDHCKPVPLFHEYLRYGYFPYYMEGEKHYYERIVNVVDYVVSSELPMVCRVENVNVRKLRMLLSIVAGLVPYELDISKLSIMLEASRNTVLNYLNYMQRAKLINLLYSDVNSLKKVQKPDKMYIENTNMLYALTADKTPIGTVRETFVVNQLSTKHQMEYGKNEGDFTVDGFYRFEVGGMDKGYKQIANLPNSYILSDDIEYPLGNKLPLWLVGLLY